ncbi:MAG: hypothetical protein ACTSWF_12425 [Candidatus Freyarchaeota archaeon]
MGIRDNDEWYTVYRVMNKTDASIKATEPKISGPHMGKTAINNNPPTIREIFPEFDESDGFVVEDLTE